jgi:glyoxylase-like metal-dependent hydrolase (beta-lactamase superfamily II)
MKIQRDVAPGVHRIEHAYTNCYVIADDSGLTLVDAGFRKTATGVRQLLRMLGRGPQDIRALLLTHGHFDHVGFARGLQHALGTPVWVHPRDQRLASHPYQYRPQQNRFAFPLAHPGSLPILTAMVAAGALTVRGVQADRTFQDEEVLDVPGNPQVLHTPGHTDGECVFVLHDRGVVLSGDALVTLDPYTGIRGPRLVAPAATADSRLALASLDRLAGLEGNLMLPGHGDIWTGGIGAAVSAARRAAGAAVAGPSGQ